MCFEFLKQRQAAGITCMQQLVYAVTSGKIMEQAIGATAKARNPAYKDYQEIPDAFERYENVCWKRTGNENKGSLSLMLLLCTPSFTRVTKKPSMSTSQT
jgi:hypothetical protein